MKQISKILGSAALAAAAFCASQAHATGQYAANTVQYTSPTYIGIMDPTANPGENASVQHTGLAQSSSFTDYWIVDINPTGNAGASMSFNGFSSSISFSAFNVSLYLDQAPITNLANAAFTCNSQDQSAGAVACASGPGSLTLVPTSNYLVGVPGTLGGAGAFTNTFLTAGRYVVVVSGTVGTGAGNGVASYNGSIQVNQIPEPGTLALAGLALLGTAAAMRKRQST
jgi:hypothetical protein